MLAMTGGCAVLFLAIAGVRGVRAFGPASVPRIQDVTLNLPVLFFTLGISVISGLLFGMAPVLRTRKPELGTALKETGRSQSGDARDRRGPQALLISPVTPPVLLWKGAGLLIRSFARRGSLGPGLR